MMPFPSDEILPMVAMMFLRLSVPAMILLMMGTFVQRFERTQM